MRTKVILPIIVIVSFTTRIWAQSENIRISDRLVVADSSTIVNLAPFEHAFFDTNATCLYLQIETPASNKGNEHSFYYLEIKKKSLQQNRLRPVISKRINPNIHTNRLVDSLVFPEQTMASGNYDLIVTYLQDSLTVLRTEKIPFQMLRAGNPHPVDYTLTADTASSLQEIDLMKSFAGKYNTETLRRNIQALSPLSNVAERRVIKELSNATEEKTMRRFFYNFWQNRNASDPEKAWNDYAVTLNELSKKYGTHSTPGYETDRGRIYIQYGAPDKIERVPTEKSALPYEIWFYYRSGEKSNLKFLFYQPGMIGNQMYLLHSNVSGEINNPGWRYQLLQDPENGDNKLIHKVFEFFK